MVWLELCLQQERQPRGAPIHSRTSVHRSWWSMSVKAFVQPLICLGVCGTVLFAPHRVCLCLERRNSYAGVGANANILILQGGPGGSVHGLQERFPCRVSHANKGGPGKSSGCEKGIPVNSAKQSLLVMPTKAPSTPRCFGGLVPILIKPPARRVSGGWRVHDRLWRPSGR